MFLISAGRRRRGESTELGSVLWQLLGALNAYLVVVLTADRVNLDPVSRPFDGLSRLDSFLRIVQ